MLEKPEGPLRRGWTTGACATAATAAAYTALLTGRFPDPVEIRLPKGQTPRFPLVRRELGDGAALAGVVKDAGDDPDVTHGALVLARVRHGAPGGGVTFEAGEGVGTVTKPGLQIPVGEPAINPAPRQMMTEAVREIAEARGAAADLVVEVAIPGGAKLAERTTNGRLGIEGGLSVLGTSGIVVPYSCSSWIYSIRQGIDVARATGLAHLAASTGSTSEAAVKALLGLPDAALLDMGDFVGGTLKYLRAHPVERLTLAGGFGKFCKLAAGHLDLHSGRSRVDFAWLAERLAELGADEKLQAEARSASSAGRVLELAQGAGLPIADAMAERARATAEEVVQGRVASEVAIFGRKGELRGRSAP
jgi:cobalt-precorrin-5B (C1)-methyltransferase